MAKLPPQKKILREDVKGAPTWVNSIIETMNNFMENVYQALNKNINDENMASQVKEITYRTPSTYPTMDDIEFTSELKIKATGLSVLQVYERSNYTPPPGPVWVPWVEDNGVIIIGPITGLEASKTYLVRLRVT